jgi:ParB family chromosome partitioning protein
MSLPTSVEPGERDLVHVIVGGQGGTCRLAEPGDDVHHSVGDARLGDDLGQPQRGQRRLLGWLEDDAVTRGQGRAELPRGHQQREVPRDDLADDADRLAQRVGVEVGARHVRHRDVDRVALDLGGPAGHVVEQVRRQRHVGGERDADRLAVVERLQLGELLGILENEVADLPDEPASFRGCHAAPRAAVECLAGGADGAVDVFGVSLGYVGEGFPGSRVRGLECLA